jgi:LacI family transcriptional regulator
VKPVSTATATDARRKKRSARFVDIAAEAGVSIATVNRVLNDHGSVSAATRERVLRAAKQLAVPRVLPDTRRGLTRFDVVLADSDTPFLRRLDFALRQYSQWLDRRIVVHRHSFDPQDDPRTARFIARPPHRRDGLLLAVHDTPDIRHAVQAVIEQGVPVVTLMSDIGDVARLHYAGIDNYRAGRSAGYFMGRFTQRSGRVVVLTNDLGFRAHRDRTGGFLAAVADHFPRLECLAIQACHDDPRRVHDAVRQALAAPGGADVVGLYHSGAGSAGAAQALQDSGRAGDVVWIGHELSDEHRGFIRAGLMDLVIDQDPDGQVLSAMQHLLHASQWADQRPPSGPNEFRLFFAENLIERPYLPAGL